MITYVGIDKRGIGRTGRGPMDPVEFTETVFGLGWRELTVKSAAGAAGRDRGRDEAGVVTSARSRPMPGGCDWFVTRFIPRT